MLVGNANNCYIIFLSQVFGRIVTRVRRLFIPSRTWFCQMFMNATRFREKGRAYGYRIYAEKKIEKTIYRVCVESVIE